MRPLVACAILAALSLLVPAAPGYDAWAWLLWGREVADLALSTAEGPAFKPLPVAVTFVLSPFGGTAPALWLFVVRCGALLGVWLAFALTRRLAREAGAGSPAVAGAFAAIAVVLTGGFVRHAAVGDAEPLLVALALSAFALALDGRHRPALALGVLAALLRVEVWPFLAAYALWSKADRRALAALAVAVPAAWFVPEWLSSGDLLRSGDRARVPNPGAPATADRPALAAIELALTAVIFLPAALAALFARGTAALPALAGAGWIALIALMSEAGFSGEARYVLPGAAVLAVSGGVGFARGWALLRTQSDSQRAHRPGTAMGILVIGTLAATSPSIGDLAGLPERLHHQHRLAGELRTVVGRVDVCGRPAVGRYRGTLLAYALDVPKHTVRADGSSGDVTFTSRLTEGAAPQPPAKGAVIAETRNWSVSGTPCPTAARAAAPPSR